MNVLEDKLLHVTKALEKQVDAAIEQIDNLDVNDLEGLRKQRLNELKKQEEQKKEYLSLGHGKYEELPEEKEFFNVIKKSKNVVIHFYTLASARSPIVDMHLKLIAPKHIETRFVKLNAEKCPFLAENLKVKTIPTLVLIQDSVMVDKIIGFTQLGNRDDFSTEMLEWRIAQNGILNYEGDLTTPPSLQKTDKRAQNTGKKIRDSAFNDDDIDLEEDGLARESTTKPTVNTELTPEEAAELGLED